MQNQTIAARIKLLCHARQIAIGQVLESCHLSKSLIYDLEKRDQSPSIDKVVALADYFGCSLDYLVGRTDEP